MSLPGTDELFRDTVTGRRPGPTGAARVAAPTPAVVENAEDAGRPRRPSGRQRHDEKITVYCSPSELVELEQARLVLRAEHGVAVDRGRIVREALGVVLSDLEAHGPDSVLVRRLRTS